MVLVQGDSGHCGDGTSHTTYDLAKTWKWSSIAIAWGPRIKNNIVLEEGELQAFRL